jgi:hypothetical protein
MGPVRSMGLEVGSHGALPRLRSEPWSVASLARPIGRRPNRTPKLSLIPPKVIERTVKRPVFGIRNLAVPTVRPRKRGSAPRVSRLS